MADTIATSTLTPKANTDGKTVPVRQFKITDIPDAMRKMDWPVAAQLMEYWFNGEPWPTEDGSIVAAVKSHHEHAPKKYINESIIKMDWVLSFPKVHSYLDELRAVWRGPRAQDEICKKFKNNFGSALPATYKLNFFGHGPLAENFGYFNYKRVDFDPVGGEVDELRAALGNFNLRVVAEGDMVVTASAYVFYPVKLGFYIDDCYDFNDESDWWRPSQLLGFWGFNGLAMSIPEVMARGLSTDEQLQSLALQSMTGDEKFFDQRYADIDSQRYYLIQNKNFQDYRRKYSRGGDFKISSDIYYEDIVSPPLVFEK